MIPKVHHSRNAGTTQCPDSPSNQKKIGSVRSTTGGNFGRRQPNIMGATIAWHGIRIPNIMVLTVCLLGTSAFSATYQVTNTADSGAGSLRQAILNANSNVGADTITFNIPGAGPHTISPASQLPTLTDNAGVTIDGFTQPGASANTNLISAGSNAIMKIVINGASAGSVNGLVITSSNNIIRGLVINGFNGPAAIDLNLPGATNNIIAGNYLGTNAAGTAAVANVGGIFARSGPTGTGCVIGGTTPADRNVISGNTVVGIRIALANGYSVQGNIIGLNAAGTGAITQNMGVRIDSGAKNNAVGGTSPGAPNVISGNGVGISIAGAGTSNNSIMANLIGTNASGTAAQGNGFGVDFSIGVNNNTVGGSGPGEGNLISGNWAGGVRIINGGTTNIRIYGNKIGLNLAGTGTIPNLFGVRIDGGAGNCFIGGTASGEGNVISGNTNQGVLLQGGTTGNTVAGNIIGASPDGLSAMPNAMGVSIQSASANNTVNGGNLIAFNTGVGVNVTGSSGNTISQNNIHSNGGLGIDLNGDGVTANDAGDGDGGPNTLQNFPLITSSQVNGDGSMDVQGTIDTLAGTVTVEVFATGSGVDPSGSGEGAFFVGSALTTTGIWNLTIPAATVAAAGLQAGGTFVSATATRSGNTSEFSPNHSTVHAPVATPDTYGAVSNTAIHVSAPGVLANDTDADGDPFSAVLVAGPANGTLTFNPDGSFVYQPAPGFAGNDSFTYQARDATGNSNTATVTIAVSAPTAVPVAVIGFVGGDGRDFGNLNVNFDASGSSDPQSRPLTSYTWDFGDGTGAATASPLVSHNYAQRGSYTVRLVVTNDLGTQSGPDVKVVVVEDREENDDDLFLRRVLVHVNWARHTLGRNQDWIKLWGRVNPAGMPESLRGLAPAMQVTINGVSLDDLSATMAAAESDDRLRARHLPRFRLRTNGTFSYLLRFADLRLVLGVHDASALGNEPVRLNVQTQISGVSINMPSQQGTLEVSPPAVAQPQSASTLHFHYSRQATQTGFFKIQRTTATASRTDAGYLVTARGPAWGDLDNALIPTGDIVLTIGDIGGGSGGDVIIVPLGSLSVRLARDGSPLLYNYSAKLNSVPELRKLVINVRRRNLTFATHSLLNTGIPLLADPATKHNLPLTVEIPTANGTFTLRTQVELVRRSGRRVWRR